MFLLTGSFALVSLIITCIIHLIIIIRTTSIFEKLIDYIYSIIIIILLILFSIYSFLCVSNRLKFTFKIIPGCLGLIWFIALFMSAKEVTHGIEVNPFSIIFIILATPLLGTIGAFLYKQSRLVLLGINTKQYMSILDFRSNFNNNYENVNKDYSKLIFPEKFNMSLKEKLINLKNVLFHKKESSLVFEELEKM